MAAAAMPVPADLLAFIYAPEDVMSMGLRLVGFDDRRIQNAGDILNHRRFRAWYGSNPNVYATLWEDLLTTDNVEARLPTKLMGRQAAFNHFLMCLHFLKAYPVEEHRAATFKVCERTSRKWTWYYVQRIAALKEQKVSFEGAYTCCRIQ